MRAQKDLIFGLRAILEAIHSGKEIEKVLFKSGLRGELFHELFSAIRDQQIPFQYVPNERLNLITRGNHQGAVAYISPVEYYDLARIIPGLFESRQTPLIVALDRITDIRNFGAIARVSECAGVHALLIPVKNAAPVNAMAVKTSSGALHSIPVCRTISITESLRFIKNSGLQLVAATEKAPTSYFDCDFTLPTCLIFGSEDTGIDPSVLQLATHQVKIPVMGTIESLNVSSAASVLMYEAVRQRIKEKKNNEHTNDNRA
mgnify:CR=1 FL=1